MPRIFASPREQRSSYTPGSGSVAFQLAGPPSVALVPGSLVLTGMISATPDAVSKGFSPAVGLTGCFSSLEVSSPLFPGLLSVMPLNRAAAVVRACRRPEDLALEGCCAGGDLSGTASTVAGTLDGAIDQASAIPFAVRLPFELLKDGLFQQLIPYAAVGGSLTIRLGLATAAASMLQARGATSATWSMWGLSLGYTNAPIVPQILKQPISYSGIQVDTMSVDAGLTSLTITTPAPIVSVAVVFIAQGRVENINEDGAALECPPSLSKVSFMVNGESAAPFEIAIGDVYGARAQADFYAALAAGGVPASTAGREIVARSSGAAPRWRQANVGYAAGGASSVMGSDRASASDSTGVAFPVGPADAYGVGAVFPPLGTQGGTLSVSITSAADSTTPYTAHVVSFWRRAIPVA